jgi:hypothetical protein
MILSSVIGSVDKDYFVKQYLTLRFVDGKGDPLDPVFRHRMEGDTTDLAYHLGSCGEDRQEYDRHGAINFRSHRHEGDISNWLLPGTILFFLFSIPGNIRPGT